jgi:hypothetical protein
LFLSGLLRRASFRHGGHGAKTARKSDEIIDTKLFEDIPTSPSMKAEMTVETLEESTHAYN